MNRDRPLKPELADERKPVPTCPHPALKGADRGKEAAARAVGTVAAPILPIDAWQGFLIGDGFLGRFDLEAGAADFHRRRRHDETVDRPTAPFAVLRAAKAAARNPVVMGIDG